MSMNWDAQTSQSQSSSNFWQIKYNLNQNTFMKFLLVKNNKLISKNVFTQNTLSELYQVKSNNKKVALKMPKFENL